MKKILYTFLLLGVVTLGAVGVLSPRTYAACDPADTTCVDTPANTPAAAEPSATKSDTTAENIATAPPAPAIPSDSTFVWVMGKLLMLFAWLLGVAAITLDNAVYYTVVTMGSVVNGLSAIGVTWRILRDIGNIALIFGFLAIGMSIILDTEKLGYGKKMLPTLLFVAVTLNFSLFVAEAVIDVSNLFATQFYTQINGGNMAQPTAYDLDTVGREGISNKIMGQLGFATIYSGVRNNEQALVANNDLTISFMAIILFLVTAFVFFSLAFVLIFRFVALVLLIISSPVGFAGLAVPKLESVAHKWWSELLNQAISAPVLLLLLYVALAVITDVNFLSGFDATSLGWLGFVGGKSLQSFAGTILSFAIAMGLLLSVTVVAKKIGAAGADKAMKWAGGASFGVAAMGASGLIGGTAFGLRRGIVQRLNPTGERGKAWQKRASRVLRYGEGVRMDMRTVPGVAAGLKLAGADEAAQAVAKSAVERRDQASQWWLHGGDAANKKMEEETRIPRLKKALEAGNRGDANKLMRGLTDDEFKRNDIQELIKTNPLAVQVLTNSQVAKLSDGVLTKKNVYENLSISQLEAYRHAGNSAPGGPTDAMQVFLLANRYNDAYMTGRRPGDVTAMKSFWHLI